MSFILQTKINLLGLLPFVSSSDHEVSENMTMRDNPGHHQYQCYMSQQQHYNILHLIVLQYPLSGLPCAFSLLHSSDCHITSRQLYMFLTSKSYIPCYCNTKMGVKCSWMIKGCPQMLKGNQNTMGTISPTFILDTSNHDNLELFLSCYPMI